MANIDTLDPSENISKEAGVGEVQDGTVAEGPAKKGADEVAVVSKPSSPAKDATPALPSPGPSLVPLRSSSTNGLSSSTSGTPTLSMPHPKKFSHSDINKRFLEKNSPSSSGSQASSTPSISKPGTAVQKPAIQTALSHSKLVTAKLTADGQRSTLTGPGWSRPPSTSSSAGPPPSAGPALAPGSAPVAAAPQPVPVGKVIQPQPRAVPDMGIGKKDSSGKLAWGSGARASSVGKPDLTQSDFPTAAEVAQVHSAKMLEKKQAAEAAAAHKEALAAEADAFRGVHLAPNAHHWDEDEGDDSNFLDEVIEFDDGRQYTIPHQQGDQHARDGLLSPPTGHPGRGEGHDQPVSKEERFGDDFDRSWPRSRTGGPVTQPHMSPSSASSHSGIHQESSRVLFNERSNRLEPYSSHPQGRFGGPPKEAFFGRRGSRSEFVASPTDMRNGRDAPPHVQAPQLLQKPGSSSEDGASPRMRGLSDHSFGGGGWHDGRGRDRDAPRRDFTGPSQMSRTFSQGGDHNRSRDHYGPPGPPGGPPDRQRRFSNMGPPPAPGLSPDLARDGRQLPPHLSDTRTSPLMWRSPSSEARRLPSISPVVSPAVAHALPARSPAVSNATLSPLPVESPLQTVAAAGPPLPLVDIDEVRKAAMHSAAERAKLRRQQEEEEREKEKERARKKAAEIEAKIKAAAEAKAAEAEAEAAAKAPPAPSKAEAEAVEFIAKAVSEVSVHDERPPRTSIGKPSLPPVPIPAGGFSRPPAHDSPRFTQAHTAVIDTRTPEPSSWRTKPARTVPPPQPPPPPREPSVPSPLRTTSILPPTLPLLAEVESFDITSGEAVEIVDFADHGKLVGAHEPPAQEPRAVQLNGVPSRPPRPVAQDFFDEKDMSRPPARSEEGSWRRKSLSTPADQAESRPPKDKPILEITPAAYEPTPAQPYWKAPAPPDAMGRVHGEVSPPHVPLRSPVTPSYREAPMSALTDTMARIKGALDGLHSKPEVPKKWLPPALRERTTPVEKPEEPHEEHTEQEVFDVTGYEPPRSPKPAWNHFAVRLPHKSRPRMLVPPGQLRLFFGRFNLRTEISSLVPPPGGPHRRDLQVNHVIFDKPYYSKGRLRCIVSLPGQRSANGKGRMPRTFEPVVNLPAKAVNHRIGGVGAFGRPSEADGAASWRRAPASTSKSSPTEESTALNTVSRSPPPETPPEQVPVAQDDAASLAISVPPPKPRTQPKLPEGSAVAFYRDSRVNSGESQPKPTVNFFVSSELEDAPRVDGSGQNDSSALIVASQAVTAAAQDHPLVPESFSSKDDPIVEFHQGNHSPIHAPITPKTQSGNLPWAKSPKDLATKESTSRSAEADHLRTVWTSTANKTDKPVSSLERIADDLAAPFPVRDGKLSEPTVRSSNGSHPSKMSLSDVTRSFQQVPTPSGASTNVDSARNVIKSPASPPTLRQPTVTLATAQPMLSMGMQPPYNGYSPMLSSPSPNMMYPPAMTPSPIPRPMVPNAQSPQYATPMWVPMPPPGMQMRPMAGPYGPQLMPYPASSMYPPPPPNMQGTPPTQPNGQRPPAMMMSPVAAQAQMYATSPVLMPAMAAMPGPGGAYPGGPGPAGVGAGRGQPQRGGYDGGPPMMQQQSFAPQPNAYQAGAPNAFLRSGW